MKLFLLFLYKKINHIAIILIYVLIPFLFGFSKGREYAKNKIKKYHKKINKKSNKRYDKIMAGNADNSRKWLLNKKNNK
jgi:hypothetical protein